MSLEGWRSVPLQEQRPIVPTDITTVFETCFNLLSHRFFNTTRNLQ